jgi:hypothetical protein
MSSFADHVDMQLSDAELVVLEDHRLTQQLISAYARTNLTAGAAADIASLLGDVMLSTQVPAPARAWLDDNIAALERHLEEIRR